MRRLDNLIRSFGFVALTSTLGCLGGSSRPADPATTPGPATGEPTTEPGSEPAPVANPLDARVVDYHQALRSAALKLVGRMPSLDEMYGVTDEATYRAQIDAYLEMPEFTRQIFGFFKNMMKLGGSETFDDNDALLTVSFDAAPAFAAKLAVDGANQMTMFTATTGTVGVYDPMTMTISTSDGPGRKCAQRDANNVVTEVPCMDLAAPQPVTGVLTDPGAMLRNYGNMAFRRAKWVQYSFACAKFPAEFSQTPVPYGNGLLTSPGGLSALSTISGRNPTYGGAETNAVDFHDASGAICANCHTTLNHIAPLFGSFGKRGFAGLAIAVPTPLGQLTKPTDWLPAGEPLKWRNGVTVTDLPSLGAALAADPEVQRCQVSRAWNWAMGKLDITEDGATVPIGTIQTSFDRFVASDFKMKELLRTVFTHDDFVKF